MPAMPLSAFSIGMMTDVVISSGEAPGSWSATLTVAGSALGNRSTPRSRNEKIPSTTSDITSIVANTGRRTQSSESIRVRSATASRYDEKLLDVAADRHLQAIGELVDVAHGDRLSRLDARDNLDAVAEPIADLQLTRAQVV